MADAAADRAGKKALATRLSRPIPSRFPRWSIDRVLCGMAMLSYGLVLVCLVALHVARSDAPPVQYLSEYALGPYGVLMTQAFVAGGTGTSALALAIAMRARGSIFSRLTSVLMLVGGAATCLLAAYPTDLNPPGPSTPAGEIHSMFGYLRVVCSAFATVLWALATRTDPRLHRHRRATVVGAALTFGAVLLIVYLPDSHTGLVQRFWIAVNLAWGFTVARAIGGFTLWAPPAASQRFSASFS